MIVPRIDSWPPGAGSAAGGGAAGGSGAGGRAVSAGSESPAREDRTAPRRRFGRRADHVQRRRSLQVRQAHRHFAERSRVVVDGQRTGPTSLGATQIDRLGARIPMQRRGAFRHRPHPQAQAGGVKQRPLLPIARRADDEINRHRCDVDSVALQRGHACPPGEIEIGKPRNVSFQPQPQAVIDNQRNESQQHDDGNHTPRRHRITPRHGFGIGEKADPSHEHHHDQGQSDDDRRLGRHREPPEFHRPAENRLEEFGDLAGRLHFGNRRNRGACRHRVDCLSLCAGEDHGVIQNRSGQ